MMITGTTGSGKSNTIHQLLNQIRANGEQAIIVDTTSGIFSRFYDEDQDILLNPLDARGKTWNLWKEADNGAGEVCEYVLDEIAESIVTDNYQQDSFWIKSARQVFVESVHYLIDHKQNTYQNLIDMTLVIPLKELSQRLRGTSVASVVDPAIDKTALSVRASLANSLKIFSYLEDRQDGGISLLNFMPKNNKSWIFLSCQPGQREFLRPLFSSQISLIIKGLMRRPEQNTSRTWIIIDELASLNKLPALLIGLAEIRKYGGYFVLGFQDLSQLEVIYGVSTAKTLSNLTGTKLLFRAVDTDVAARTARYLGEQEKQEANESISFGAHQMRDGVSLSNQKQTKSVVTASQIMMLNDLEAYLKFPQNLPVTKVKFDYVAVEKKAVAFVARPKKLQKPKHQSNEQGQTEEHESDIEALPVIKMPMQHSI